MDKEEFLEEFEDYCYDNFDDKNFQKEVSSFFEKFMEINDSYNGDYEKMITTIALTGFVSIREYDVNNRFPLTEDECSKMYKKCYDTITDKLIPHVCDKYDENIIDLLKGFKIITKYDDEYGINEVLKYMYFYDNDYAPMYYDLMKMFLQEIAYCFCVYMNFEEIK